MRKDKWEIFIPAAALIMAVGSLGISFFYSKAAEVSAMNAELSNLKRMRDQLREEIKTPAGPLNWTDLSAEQRRRIFGQLLDRYPTIFRPRNEWGWEEIPTGRPTIIPGIDPDAKQGGK